MSYYQTKNNISIEAEKYYSGIEDGFTKVDQSQCSFCQDSCQGCLNYRPYINTTHGKMVIHANDYIVYDYTGRRHVIGGRLFEQIFNNHLTKI